MKKTLRILLPFALAIGILWWMYRGTDWREFFRSVTGEMRWGWMLFSLVFGVLAQQVRAWRWKLALEPLGERPRRRTAEDAIFLSYAASLVVPRIGEVMRCGSLQRSDGVPFAKSLGTVVTERIVDSLMIAALTALALLTQLPVFVKFLQTTGTDLYGLLGRFTATGYLVTALCLVTAIAAGAYLLGKYVKSGKDLLRDLRAGILSLKNVRSLPLYLLYSLLIWVFYFLHFYVAFFSFAFTAGVSPLSAFLIFCIGSFAVLVPTPNGAGPWHFAVKTMLVLLYPTAISEAQAILFALVVHTIQTALVVLLGAWGWTHLLLVPKHTGKTFTTPT
ncbi:MAG: flippase-like domain-containing protein [Alloprevotella sp.]|nr:flippase-like domain-containing protein [Alloprevotella sp.]